MASIDDMYRLLDDLASKDFKRFKEYLRRRTLPGFEPIPLSLLEKADVTDTVRLMTQRYGNNRCMEITQHILNTMGHKNSTQEQLGQTSENSSIGSTNQTVSGGRTGVTQDITSLNLRSSEAGNNISDATPSDNTSTTHRRKWKSRSQRWREKMKELANMEDSKVKKVDSLTFIPDERFRIGLGDIFLGLKKDGTEVAVKMMLETKFDQFQKELDILQEYRFHSLRIVQYVDSAVKDGIGYIAMQLCEYNLKEYITQKQPSEAERKRIVLEFLEGLKDLHEHPDVKVIHRDIKPQNILIDSSKRVRFADFGISRTLEPGQTTKVTGRAGTDCWEATEVVNHPGEDQKIRYKRNTDIQVAGMLVYYTLSGGKHPYGEGVPGLFNISKGAYQLKDLTDKEAKDLVKSMLNVNPEQRPRITKVFDHPYFLDEKGKNDYLKKVGDVPEVQYYEKSCEDERLMEVLKKLEEGEDKKTYTTWKTQLDHISDEDMKARWFDLVKTYAKNDTKFPETLLCLLRFLRNRWTHQPEKMESINVMKLFPDLVVTAYKLDIERGWNIKTSLPQTPSVKRKAESSNPVEVGSQEPNVPPQKQIRSEPNPMDVDKPSTSESAPSMSYQHLHLSGNDFFLKHKAALETRLGPLHIILNQLQERRVLNDHEREVVTSKSLGTEKNYALLTMIKNKGATAQQAFYEVLKETDLSLVKDLVLGK